MGVKEGKISKIVYHSILIISSLIIILPFIWLVSTSFDTFTSYSLPYPPRFLPEEPTLLNYKLALNNVPIIKYLTNTVIIAVMSVVSNVFLSTLAGFALSKGKFKYKSIIIMFILSNMMIPFESKLLPVYDIINTLGVTNNFIGVILPGIMTNAMYIFFVKQYCDDLPDVLYEAAVIDGAKKFTIYSRVFLPLMGPIIATIIILDVVNVWNDLLWPSIVLTKESLYTVQVGLVIANTSQSGASHAGISTALSILSVLPLGLLFLFLQRYIVQSIAATGIKQ